MTPPTPIVLIPGLLCTWELYAPQLPVLRAIAPTMVADHAVAATMADIARNILSRSPPKFALCGLSMGGHIAFEIMRQAPERVTKLALLDTSARDDTPDRRAERLRIVAAAETFGLRSGPAQVLPGMLHPDRLADAALLEVLARMAIETGPTHFARQQAAIAARPDSRPTLATIRVPTLVLCGRQDTRTPLAHSEEIAAGIANSRLVVVERCGHLSTLERPDAVNQALSAWALA